MSHVCLIVCVTCNPSHVTDYMSRITYHLSPEHHFRDLQLLGNPSGRRPLKQLQGKETNKHTKTLTSQLTK